MQNEIDNWLSTISGLWLQAVDAVIAVSGMVDDIQMSLDQLRFQVGSGQPPSDWRQQVIALVDSACASGVYIGDLANHMGGSLFGMLQNRQLIIPKSN